jgi:hypothetical protein
MHGWIDFPGIRYIDLAAANLAAFTSASARLDAAFRGMCNPNDPFRSPLALSESGISLPSE